MARKTCGLVRIDTRRSDVYWSDVYFAALQMVRSKMRCLPDCPYCVVHDAWDSHRFYSTNRVFDGLLTATLQEGPPFFFRISVTGMCPNICLDYHLHILDGRSFFYDQLCWILPHPAAVGVLYLHLCVILSHGNFVYPALHTFRPPCARSELHYGSEI